jgi:hypothetical protein
MIMSGPTEWELQMCREFGELMELLKGFMEKLEQVGVARVLARNSSNIVSP